MNKQYDCVVIGAGHAGVEAALAASRMGCKTLMVTLFKHTIGQMSCNPAIGGVGKGQLVKEVDALGGLMGVAADRTGIQFRQLNASKGQAVRSSRCQSDRARYKAFVQQVIFDQQGLEILEDEVTELIVHGQQVQGLKTAQGHVIKTAAVVVTTGTFLKGRIHIGKDITAGGRINEPNSTLLARCFEDLGFPVVLFKTGTPPRLDGKTIDFSQLEPQHSDDPPVPFSFRTPFIAPEQKLIPCHITFTTEETHRIIEDHFHLSPMYSGQIDATGVRYCPSIEDKLKKFSDRQRHHVFLEPEGLDTDEYYPNGISTGLPLEIQERFVRTIPGLEQVKITKPGYSIEHGVIPPTHLQPTLETKSVKGLFLAGQINGTTGYEEAGAQGLLAGINAALKVKNQSEFILARNQSYIGVLMDDLTTKGTEEPYRMFTSRVEYRLLIREDNADERLSRFGYQFGLLSEDDFLQIQKKYENIKEHHQRLATRRLRPSETINDVLKAASSSPITQMVSLADLLKRPEMTYDFFVKTFSEPDVPKDVQERLEYDIKYQGFIDRQRKDVEKFRHIENIRIPKDFVYEGIDGLSIEIRQKLNNAKPCNLGQANRISGVTPAAITILMIALKKRHKV